MKFLKSWSPLLGYMALMWYLSSKPMDIRPFLDIPFADKMAHFVEYFIFGYLLARAILPAEKYTYRSFLAIGVVVAALIWGVIDEVHQLYVPTREASFFDILADTAGAGLGGVIKIYRNKNATI